MDVSSLYGLAGIPVVLALVQAIKAARPADDRVWPLVTLLVAVGFNLGLSGLIGAPIGAAVGVGILTGLSASGLYSHATTYLAGASGGQARGGQPRGAAPTPTLVSAAVPVPVAVPTVVNVPPSVVGPSVAAKKEG